MHIKKDFNIEITYIQNNCGSKEELNKDILKCGKNIDSEFKGIVNFDLEEIKKLNKIEGNIGKVELCLNLKSLELEEYVETLMLDIGINIEKADISKGGNHKCLQKCYIYTIKKEYVEKYVRFDITHIIEEYLINNRENFGLTLIPINLGGIAEFGEKESYIKIQYKEEIKEECKCEKKSYGFFINTTGRMVKGKKECLILWDEEVERSNINVLKNRTDILINNAGIYQVDYSMNIRSCDIGYMFLKINGEVVRSSIVQTGVDEHMYTGYAILNISRNNSLVELGLINKNAMIMSSGIASSIRLIKI